MPIFSSITPTVTAVNASVASVQLFAVAPSAQSRMVYNDSDYPLYLKFGTDASPSSFTAKIWPGGLYEFPAVPLFRGVVHGAWSGATGTAQVTEVA